MDRVTNCVARLSTAAARVHDCMSPRLSTAAARVHTAWRASCMRSAWHTLHIWLYVAWAWIAGNVHRHVRSKSTPEWRITAALAFCEDSGAFRDITHAFFPDGWEEDVDAFLGWKRVRIDVRYIHTSQFGKVTKYRMVLRPGDTCVFPPRLETTSRGPRGVLAARLDPLVSDARPVDVSGRIIKYAGPARDFHAGQGLCVRPLDCFPCDDHDALPERFQALVITDAASFREQVFPLDANPPIALDSINQHHHLHCSA